MGQVANDAAVADNGREVRAGVDHRAVLNRRASADRDGSIVTAEDGPGPDGGFGANGDVADDDRIRVHVRLGINGRRYPFVFVDRHERRRYRTSRDYRATGLSGNQRPQGSHVAGDPGDALITPITQVDDRSAQHGLEVPGDRRSLMVNQDGPAGGALPLVAEVVVFDQGVALLAPGH